jgi:hypothetical protein
VGETMVQKRLDGYAAFVQKPFKVSYVLQLIASVIGEGEASTA